ncbi:MAG: universal stress protein [Alphaproteobacteria bacterium]|nr:universal stress protein [Alphaproteobacteria bacterium]
MKTILAVVGDGAAEAVLEAAVLAARRFDSKITGLNALASEYAVVFGGEMGFSISSEVDRTLEREGAERREQARNLFNSVMRRRGIALGAGAGGGVSAEWREEAGRQNAIVGTLGRVYDLIVVEQPNKAASFAEATLEDALFESGRPVLMAPKAVPAALGERILVAWNGSTETARTVAFAMPFLKRAVRVEVVSVEGAFVPGPAADELVRNLKAHGIESAARHIAVGNKPPGEIFLDEARAMQADLLVKGAYTQSRLRQMIFGGATRHVILNAGIPVLLAH